MKGEHSMTYEETIAHLQDKVDEHNDVLHRTLTLVDKLHDRVALLEARAAVYDDPAGESQPRNNTH